MRLLRKLFIPWFLFNQSVIRAPSCAPCLGKLGMALLKNLTVPKLALSVAVLLALLLGRVTRVLKIDHSSVYAFSNSQIVLSWLVKSLDAWKIFISKRVTKIVSIVPFNRWRYIPMQITPRTWPLPVF